MSNGRTIAIDFDGVIHLYSKGWQDGSIYDPPVEGAIDAIKTLMDKGYKVVVFTARPNLVDIQEFFLDNGISGLMEVTNKKPIASVYIDDRAIRFTNWKDMLNYL